MKTSILKLATLASSLMFFSTVSAQSIGTDGFSDNDLISPTALSPLGPEVDQANPLFTWSVVSNSTTYRLLVRLDDGTVRRYRFFVGPDGQTVTGPNGVACLNNADVNTTCNFTPTDLNLADGQEFVWRVGAANTFFGPVTAGGFADSTVQRVQYFQFGAAASLLSGVSLFTPRGNQSDDAGTERSRGGGPITFHWENFSDASSFRLELETFPEGNRLTTVTIPLADANCLSGPSEDGIFDACSFPFDAEGAVNGAATDFCWRIVPQNARATPPVDDNAPQACFAAR